MIKLADILKQLLLEEKVKRDRCLRIADRKFDKPSAYKSGAVVRCRKGDIWKNLKESNENSQIDTINNIFDSNQELANIGTPEQYTKYLKTIFPNSKVKDIVYHVSPNKFIKFKDPSSSGLSHIWFSSKPLTGQFGNNVYSVLLNLQNPLSEKDIDYDKEIRKYENPTNPDWINNYASTGEQPKFKYDGTIRSSRVSGGWDTTVRNPEQIHILGSKEDIEGFKKFVNALTEVKKETLRTWFKRSGTPGKEGGWVDCNTCRDGKCKACGRKKGEKRAKYPSCRPTPAQCKSPGKGKKWGKTK